MEYKRKGVYLPIIAYAMFVHASIYVCLFECMYTVVFLGEEGERRGRVTSDDVLDILAIFYYFSVLSAYVDS